MTFPSESRETIPPLWLTLLWVAGMPTLFVFGNNALAPLPVITVDRLFLAAVVGLVGVRLLRYPASLQPLSRLELALTVYLTVVVLSWLTTLREKDSVTLKQDADFLLNSFFMPATAFVVARNTAWTRQRVFGCLWVLAVGVGGYLLVVGILRYACGWDFVAPPGENIHPDRLTGPFNSALPYGVVLSLLLCGVLFLVLHLRGRRTHLALLLVGAVLLEAIVLSKSRAIWLGVLLAMVLIAWQRPRARRLAALITVVLVGRVVLGSVPVHLLGETRLISGFDAVASLWDLSQRLTEVEPTYNRVAVYATALNMIAHKPLFGFGFGLWTFMRSKVDYYRSWGGVPIKWAVYPGHPHNEFLNVLVLTGVVGLAAYVALLWAIGTVLARQATRSDDPFQSDLAALVQAGFIVLLVTAQFHDVMYMSYPQTLFFFLLGIVARQPAPVDTVVVRAGQ